MFEYCDYQASVIVLSNLVTRPMSLCLSILVTRTVVLCLSNLVTRPSVIVFEYYSY